MRERERKRAREERARARERERPRRQGERERASESESEIQTEAGQSNVLRLARVFECLTFSNPRQVIMVKGRRRRESEGRTRRE